jgi:thiamine-monophosphate kinase
LALKINEIGEFGLIESIRKNCPPLRSGVVKGIGDDCAVYQSSPGRVSLLTTDMLVEDVHFLLSSITPFQLGRKAIAVNLSDIAAMGGNPLVALISLGIPPDRAVEEIHELYRGMRDMCGRYAVSIVGGDTVASHGNLIINVCLIGEADEREVLYRSGARPGDNIYLTGVVGDSAAGLAILKGEITASESLAAHFLKAHNEPDPLIDTGRTIAASRLASAMIDVSDGLAADLGHIAEQSGVGALLFENKIPLSRELKGLTDYADRTPLDFALSGGEDYVLLVTVPAENMQEFEQACQKESTFSLFQVGEIQEEKGIRIRYEDGSVEELAHKGFDHFSGPS